MYVESVTFDLYVESDTLLLADTLENLWNMGLEIYKLNPADFLTAPGSMASKFKNNRVRLDLLTDIDMVLMVEKGIIRGICHVIHRYAKANNK